MSLTGVTSQCLLHAPAFGDQSFVPWHNLARLSSLGWFIAKLFSKIEEYFSA